MKSRLCPNPSNSPSVVSRHSFPIFRGLSKFLSLQFSSLLSHRAGSRMGQISHHTKPSLSPWFPMDERQTRMAGAWILMRGLDSRLKRWWWTLKVFLASGSVDSSHFSPLCQQYLSSCRTGDSMADNLGSRGRDVQSFCKRVYRLPCFPCIEGCDVCLAKTNKHTHK